MWLTGRFRLGQWVCGLLGWAPPTIHCSLVPKAVPESGLLSRLVHWMPPPGSLPWFSGHEGPVPPWSSMAVALLSHHQSQLIPPAYGYVCNLSQALSIPGPSIPLNTSVSRDSSYPCATDGKQGLSEVQGACLTPQVCGRLRFELGLGRFGQVHSALPGL